MPMVGQNRIGVTLLLFLAVAAPVALPSARGETLRFPLALSVETGTNGDYLAAPFDFRTSFSHVESLQLELVIPDGYKGSAGGTPEVSHFREFVAVLHNVDAVPKTDRSNGGPGEDFRSTSLLSIPPASPYTVYFSPTSYSWVDGEIVFHESWPAFVLNGHGRLALIDQSHVNPYFFQASSYTSWLPPEGIAQATLIIVGTPVPEPNLSALLLACVVMTGMRRLRKYGCQ